jgi:hypothetical protein
MNKCENETLPATWLICGTGPVPSAPHQQSEADCRGMWRGPGVHRFAYLSFRPVTVLHHAAGHTSNFTDPDFIKTLLKDLNYFVFKIFVSHQMKILKKLKKIFLAVQNKNETNSYFLS